MVTFLRYIGRFVAGDNLVDMNHGTCFLKFVIIMCERSVFGVAVCRLLAIAWWIIRS